MYGLINIQCAEDRRFPCSCHMWYHRTQRDHVGLYDNNACMCSHLLCKILLDIVMFSSIFIDWLFDIITVNAIRTFNLDMIIMLSTLSVDDNWV